MIKRYAVIFDKYKGYRWTSRLVRAFRTRERAECFAQEMGDHHKDLWVTRATYHDRRSTIEVRDRKTKKKLWEHHGVIVPSVGDLGYF